MNTFNTESTTNLTPADRDIKTTSPLDKWRKGGLINSSTQTEQPTVPAPQLSPEPTPTPESPKRNFWSRLFDRPTQPLHDTARDEKSPHVNHDNDNSGQVTFDMPGQRTKEEKREEKPTDQQEPQLSVFGGGTSFADSTAHFASEDTTNDNPPPTETKDRTNSRRTFLRNAGLVGAGILGIKGVTALAQDVSKILAKPVPQFPNPEAKQDASATKPEPSPSPSPEVTPSPV